MHQTRSLQALPQSSDSNGRAVLLAAFLLFFQLALPVHPNLMAQQDATGELDAQMEKALQLQIGGQLEEARGIYLELIPKLRQQASSKALASALNRMSLIGHALGDYTQALQMAGEAAEIRRGLGNAVGQARSTNNMGLALLSLGEYEQAIQKYQQALLLDEQNQDTQGEVIRNNNIGNVYFFQGRYFDALRHYQTALELADEHSDQPWSAEDRQLALANLAVVYQKLGQYQRALDLYVQLRQGSQRLPASQEAQILSNQGTLYRRLGDPVKALENYRQALQLYEQERLLDGEMAALQNTGIALALDLKDYERALDTFLRVAQMSSQASNRRQEVQARLYAAETLRRIGRLQEAQEQFRTVLSAARELGISEEEWKALYGLGRIAESQGKADQARASLRQAIRVIESERSALRLTSLKSGFLADKQEVYDSLVEILIGDRGQAGQQGPEGLEEVLRLLEQARARSFQDRYSNSLEERERRRNPQLVHQLRELRSKVARLWSQQLRAEGGRRDDLRSQLADLENRFVAKEREYFRSRPASGLTLHEAQQKVPQGSLVIEAWTGARKIAFLWLDGESAGLVTQPLEPGFQAGLSDCLKSLSAAPRQPEAGSAPIPAGSAHISKLNLCQQAAEALAAGLSQALAPGVDNLIIIPGTSLSSFPFEILSLPDGRLLVEAYSVSYLPSLTLLSTGSEAERTLSSYCPWSDSLVAFGNPRRAGQASPGALREEEWANLPFAEEEVRAIAQQIPGRSRIYLGPQASKERFLEESAASPLMMHLATHATLDPADPQRSRILLSGEPGQPGPGYLFLGEVLSLDLPRTRLVTLSACETAGGSGGTGEVQDLGRAFLIAGAETTVAALWSVPDQTASQFMSAFYRGLAEGLGRAEALRRAKIRFIESNTALAHPYHWAGFVLYGQGASPIPLPLSWPRALLPLAGLALLMAAALYWRRRSFSRLSRVSQKV